MSFGDATSAKAIASKSFDSILEKQKVTMSRLTDCCSQAEHLANQIAGGEPTPPTQQPLEIKQAPTPVPSGYVEQILDQQDKTNAQIDRLTYLLNRISSVI